MKKALFCLLFLLYMGISFLVSLEPDYEQFFTIEELFNEGRYEESLEKYDDFLRDYPDSSLLPFAYYHRAISLYKQDQMDKALEAFRFIEHRLPEQPFSGQIPFWIGMCHYRLDSFSTAIEYLQRFTEQHDNQLLVGQAIYYTIFSYIELDQYSRAADVIKSSVKRFSASSFLNKAVDVLCDRLLTEQRYEELIRFIDSLDEQQFQPVTRQNLRLYHAESLRELNQIEEAKALYQELLSADPSVSAVAYHRLYFFAQQTEDRRKMDNILLEVERKFAGNQAILNEFWLKAGLESFERGELVLAEYFLTRVWESRMGTAIPKEGPITLAEIFIQTNRTEQALEMLLEFVKIPDVESIEAHLKIGNILLSQEEYQRAVEHFHIARERGEDESLVQQSGYHLAFSYEMLSQHGDALTAIQPFIDNNQTTSASDSNGSPADNQETGTESSPGTGELYQKMRDLHINILWNLGRLEDAEQAARSYVEDYPDSIKRWIDLEKLLAEQEKYRSLLETGNTISIRYPSLQTEYPALFPTHTYLSGLAAYFEGQYEDAVEYLLPLLTEDISDKDITDIKSYLPNILYYYSYSLFELNRYDQAIDSLRRLIGSYPDHPYSQDAYFLAGLSSYNSKKYADASSFFEAVTTTEDNLNLKAMYKRGRSLTDNGNLEDAAGLFRRLYQRYGEAELADDAMVQYAIVLGNMGNSDEAVKVFREFPRRFQASTLQDDALFQLALLYFNNEQFGRAKDIFKEYDYLYPDGKYVDHALYLSGICSQKTGESTEALLLWERVINRYTQSDYRKNAIEKAAQRYEAQNDYENALTLYTSLIKEYPDFAAKQNVQQKINELRLLIAGDTEKMAELKTTIATKDGAETPDGRKAMVELASIYILENKGNLEEAYSMLDRVIEKNDPTVHGRALFLLGEYFALQKNYAGAYDAYVMTSNTAEADRNTKAKALYRAAEMMRLQGNKEKVTQIVDRLQREYSDTEWAADAGKLLEGL